MEISGRYGNGQFSSFVVVVALSTLLLTWADPFRSEAYIMPAKQVIKLMSDNFSGIRSLVITQATNLKARENQETELKFQEKVWLKSPDIHLNEIVQGPTSPENNGALSTYRKAIRDRTFRFILMSSEAEKTTELLVGMGINLDSIALARHDGVIVYKIGDEGLDSPKLLVEKKRFLPLFLSYRPPPGTLQGMITVEFADYRKVENVWYPFQIYYIEDRGDFIEARSIVLELKLNVPVEPPTFRESTQIPR